MWCLPSTNCPSYWHGVLHKYQNEDCFLSTVFPFLWPAASAWKSGQKEDNRATHYIRREARRVESAHSVNSGRLYDTSLVRRPTAMYFTNTCVILFLCWRVASLSTKIQNTKIKKQGIFQSQSPLFTFLPLDSLSLSQSLFSNHGLGHLAPSNLAGEKNIKISTVDLKPGEG